MGVHYVEAAPHKNICANKKASRGEVKVFYNITKKGFQPNEKQIQSATISSHCLFKQLQCRYAVNFNTIPVFARRLALVPKCDHRDLVTRISEQTCLIRDASVLWEIVFDPHKDFGWRSHDCTVL